MEQIKEFEKRMDAALDHIAVHLKSSPQAGEKKDHAVAELEAQTTRGSLARV